jgi:zona occludens toxin
MKKEREHETQASYRCDRGDTSGRLREAHQTVGGPVIFGVKGTPGAGKSFYATRKIANDLLLGKCVVGNITMRPDWAEIIAKHDYIGRAKVRNFGQLERSLKARYHQLDPDDPDAMRELFRVRIAGTKEGRAVAVLDEAHNWLNARTWNGEDRAEYVRWFTLHRKLGFDVYLISQAIESIDAQIRRLIEYEVVLRNMKQFRVAGISLVPVNFFLAITVWKAGPNGQPIIIRREGFPLSWKRHLYDTMGLAHGMAGEFARSDALWLPRMAEPDASVGCEAPAGAQAGHLEPLARPGLELAGFASCPDPTGELGGEGDPADKLAEGR